MNHRLHIHKKAFSQSASTPASNLFQSRPFAVPETATPTPQETPDLQQQQEREQPKGMNLLEIPNLVAGSSPPPEPPPGLGLQAKLTIGEPGDRYEQEADRVAADVVQRIHAPSPQVQREEIESVGDEQMQMSPFVQQWRNSLVQRREQESTEEEQIRMSPIGPHWRNALVQRQDVLDEEQVMMKPQVSFLQREEVQELNLKSNIQNPKSEGMGAAPDLETSIQGARGSGQPLANSVREPMEGAFGADFSGVRVHTDATSDQLNQSIQAKAFTTGSDIFFRQGAYEPSSRGGQELIAHELTHVVQQSGERVQHLQPKRQKAEAMSPNDSKVSVSSKNLSPPPFLKGNHATATTLTLQRTPEYSGSFPDEVSDQKTAAAVITQIQQWLAAFEKRWGLTRPLEQLRTQLTQAAALADGGATVINAKMGMIKTLLRAQQAAKERLGEKMDWDSLGDTEQSEEPKYLDNPGSGVEDTMLLAASGQDKAPIDPNSAWTTGPIEIAASDPAVPEALRVLIRFIATTDSAVGLEYRPNGNRNHVPEGEPRMADQVGNETRGALPNRGLREFEKAQFGLLRSWHLDEKKRLPHPTQDELNTARASGGRAASYLEANEADFAAGLGVPEKLRGGNLQAVGLAEFNTPKIGQNGRLVYDYLNHIFYFTPNHYNPWKSHVVKGEPELFPFFKLTHTEHLLLSFQGVQELARLRYWETKRREGLETLLKP